MRIFPTHCERCSTSALVVASRIEAGTATCSECGASAVVLPGEAYNEDDAPLFADVLTTLHEAGISPSQAALLATELDARHAAPPGRCLRRLAQVLPTLGVLELLVGTHPATLRKAESMLALLLGVMSRQRRHSELISAVRPRPKAGGESS